MIFFNVTANYYVTNGK